MPHVDPEKRRAYEHTRYLKRRTEHNKQIREYRIAHPETVNAYLSSWRKRNIAKVRHWSSLAKAKRRKANGSHTLAEWESVLKQHAYKCAACGVKTALTKDHIIPISRGGTNYVFNLQPLCKSCNSKKRNKMPPGSQHTLFDRVA